jgi:hypothetical protein
MANFSRSFLAKSQTLVTHVLPQEENKFHNMTKQRNRSSAKPNDVQKTNFHEKILANALLGV